MTTLDQHLEAEACPHLAVFLRSADELPGVLVSFYSLGLRRGGWLAHRALPGDADRERSLLTAAGLDVAGLEAQERMVLVEMDPSAPAEGSAEPWREALDDALARGCSGLWYARFPVGPEAGAAFDHMLAVEREWHRMSRDRPVVTICPFIVGELDGGATIATVRKVSEMHTGVLVPAGEGEYSLLRPG
jgi:MEDS: MEthanogen/methylotroph, DcmR Sensory domain